ncbi:protein FAM110C [Brienomyrus brachyistius]|uniref:protein FAM110C n=1 Tax=Brienomyrus brachyistius TaxID=42636 RepID=UPI0020B3E00A|nr:protein FAM110C [Brienomyrus brachyistius]
MNSSKAAVASRILGKGPEYLRKQIDREVESKGRPSAAERLAASKQQYVKSPQLIASEKEPEPLLTFSLASASSSDSSSRSSSPSAGDKLRIPTLQSGDGARREAAAIARPGSSKRQRPDSLLVHRQRCENAKGSRTENAKGTFVRRLFPGSQKDKISVCPGAAVKECDPGKVSKPVQNEKPEIKARLRLPDDHGHVPPQGAKPRNTVLRSHSDISSRYSRNFSEFETFFKYCGLDGDVIETLGKENFSVPSNEQSDRTRSVSESQTDDGFSCKSDESDGLLEEELAEKSRQNTSIVERNARIIKWLYSCKNANESGKVLRDLQ